jgi:hypothetical protein
MGPSRSFGEDGKSRDDVDFRPPAAQAAACSRSGSRLIRMFIHFSIVLSVFSGFMAMVSDIRGADLQPLQ